MRWGLVLSLVLMSAPAVRAAVILASDSATDPAYTTGWGPGTNGGSGWGGAWSMVNQTNVAITATNGGRGWFTGNSTGNDNTAGDTNADGDIGAKAWGLFSNTSNVGSPPAANTDQIFAVRPLAAMLQIGQTLSFDMDNGNVATSQVVGMRLLSSATDVNTRVFEIRFVGGDANYSLIATPNAATTVPFTREGVHVDYTLTGSNTFSLKATRLVDGSVFTTTGTNANANSIAAVAFKNQLAGTGATADAYFNNLTLSTVPEPATIGAVAMGSLLLGARRKRR